MLRRRLLDSTTRTSTLLLKDQTSSSSSTILRETKRTGFFDAVKSAMGGAKPSSSTANAPPGLDPSRLKAFQDLLGSQSPEKQAQLMKQAMEFERMMGKIPGFGSFAKKNAQMMQQMQEMLKSQQAPPPPSGEANKGNGPIRDMTTAPQTAASSSAYQTPKASSSAQRDGSAGPTLDDLQRINLGPELEALFAELRTLRAKKNEYRDQWAVTKAALEDATATNAKLAATEVSLREKLKRTEQNVMLLTSENMELQECKQQLRLLKETHKNLTQELHHRQQSATSARAVNSPAYGALEQQLKSKDEALRSIHRKLDRMRRRDPLLQFSLACSDVARLCSSAEKDLNKAPSEEAFAALQTSYQREQHAAWMKAATTDGAAAKAYIAVVRRFLCCNVPHANYDAVVTISGDAQAAKAVLVSAGLHVAPSTSPGVENTFVVTAGYDVDPLLATPGPFAYCFALWLSGHLRNRADTTATTPTPTRTFVISSAHPMISEGLVNNTKRSSVAYQTARASGPGGQATNVTETQVYASLSVDGRFAYNAEAQDSRSALSNREAALQKLGTQSRVQYNEVVAKQNRAEDLARSLVQHLVDSGGLSISSDIIQMVSGAETAGFISAADSALVQSLLSLSSAAAAAQSPAQ